MYLLYVFIAATAALAIKLILLFHAMDEICDELDAKLREETNTLISVSSGDRHVRHVAARLNAQLRTLRERRHRLQRGDLELKESVTNISHDLRTPLTAICGYLDLLEREEKSEAAARYVEIIKGRTQALRALTEELFRYSLVGADAQPLSLEPVDVGGVLEEVLIAHYSALTERGIDPVIHMPELAVVRPLNRAGLARVFGNILSNVVKYSDGDLEIELASDGALRFSNAASALDEVRVGRMFDRYYTVETGRDATGLGLSIAKALTECMGGRIWADYRNGRLELQLQFGSEGAEGSGANPAAAGERARQ